MYDLVSWVADQDHRNIFSNDTIILDAVTNKWAWPYDAAA